CDYHYHGANRLGANSLLSCIFSGLFLGPCLQNKLNSQKGTAAVCECFPVPFPTTGLPLNQP
ncbi:MAG: hypothetical protein ACK52A_13940, partial [Planctomycetota bacterium]